MKITTTQLRNIIKTEVKRLGGKGLNEALPRSGRVDGLPGPVDDESDRARARRGRAPMPARGGADFYTIAPQVEAKLDELNSMTIDLGQTRTRLAVKTLCQDIVNLLEQMK